LSEQDRCHRVDVAQGAVGAGEAERFLAGVAVGAVEAEALVVATFRAAATTPRRRHQGIAACHEPRRFTARIGRKTEPVGIVAAAGRAVMKDHGRKRPGAVGLVGEDREPDALAIDGDRHHRTLLRHDGRDEEKGDQESD
jgi:hypothetical protein